MSVEGAVTESDATIGDCGVAGDSCEIVDMQGDDRIEDRVKEASIDMSSSLCINRWGVEVIKEC